MRRNRSPNPKQFVLELERPNPEPLFLANPKGLVEALADLLLEAMSDQGSGMKEERDEHQDHA